MSLMKRQHADVQEDREGHPVQWLLCNVSFCLKAKKVLQILRIREFPSPFYREKLRKNKLLEKANNFQQDILFKH